MADVRALLYSTLLVFNFFEFHQCRIGVVYHSSCKDCDQFYIGESGRNLKRRLDEQDRTIKLGKVTQSAIARHCLKSDHKFDFDGTRVLDMMSSKQNRLILEAGT